MMTMRDNTPTTFHEPLMPLIFLPSSCCRSVHNSGAPDDQVQVPLSAGEYCLRSHWSVNPTHASVYSRQLWLILDTPFVSTQRHAWCVYMGNSVRHSAIYGLRCGG